MSKSLLYRSLAIEALRLMRQQDPQVVTGVFKTNAAELLAAQEWLAQTDMQDVAGIKVSEEEKPVAMKFKDATEAEIKALADSLTRGGAADFADYKLKVGKIAGLRAAFEQYGKIVEEN